MTDVRLTATNPEDSSVVPVACNAKGELKLEEPIAPPEFDGNLDGDLNVTGTATVGLAIRTDSLYISPSVEGINSGFVSSMRGEFGDYSNYTRGTDKDDNITWGIESSNGSALFGGNWSEADQQNFSARIGGPSPFKFRSNVNSGALVDFHQGGAAANDVVASINHDGSVEFAGNKAGITSEGWLYVKTKRGESVMLNNLVNGLGEWIAYTPPSRRDAAQEKLEEWSEKVEEWSEKDKPAVSDEDPLENGQVRK